MRHFTHKSWLKVIGGTILTLSVAVALSFSAATHAIAVAEPDLSITDEAKKAVTCFVFARELNLGQDTLNIYLSRVGKASATFGAVYQLGLDTGMLSAYGFANAGRIGSVKAARLDAANKLYGLYGCSANESI